MVPKQMRTPGILLMFHCEQNTGYAIEKLEHTFKEAALKAGFSEDAIHYSYLQVQQSEPNIHQINYWDVADKQVLKNIVTKYHIQTVLAFDLAFPSWVCSEAKKAGAKKVIAYWGASMSSLNSGIKLQLKKLEYYCRKKHAADLYIFESKAMQQTATQGRGIPENITTAFPLGVDTTIYKPELTPSFYAHDLFKIPHNRKIIFYSGHMEARKGVAVLIKCAIDLYLSEKHDYHFLICGNKNSEEKPYIKMLEEHSGTAEHITFAGYRNDIPELMRSSDIGVIASTGWDSFTMSSIEMLASGLPLIVSKLQGLKETVIPGITGEYIEPGNHKQLSQKLIMILENPIKYKQYSTQAREKAETAFSIENQINRIAACLN